MDRRGLWADQDSGGRRITVAEGVESQIDGKKGQKGTPGGGLGVVGEWCKSLVKVGK